MLYLYPGHHQALLLMPGHPAKPRQSFKQFWVSADASCHQHSLSKVSLLGVERVVTDVAFELAHAHVAHTLVQLCTAP